MLHEADLYDGNNVLQAKTILWYDYSGTYLVPTASPDTPPQHDPSFDSTYLWRGNVSLAESYDVNDPNNQDQATQVFTGYNTSGSVVFVNQKHKADVWHQMSINYGDSFSDGNNSRNTFAYPTMVTDADGFSSYIQYNFEFGETTRTQTPSPNANQTPPAQVMSYDSARRLLQVSNTVNNAYLRYAYGPTYIQSYSSVNNVADDTYMIQGFDGLGRQIATASNHPSSTGGYKAQLTAYDVMGRAVKQSNPAEINVGWGRLVMTR